jgi:ABC-2 type transport system permease protein
MTTETSHATLTELSRPADASAEVNLVDVPGPSALGGGFKRALELLWMIAVTDFKKTYFGTALGYLWSLARPLLLFAVLLTVFTKVFRLHGVPHYEVMLLTGIVLFTFFQEATMLAVGSVTAQEAVVRKTQFPRLVIPLAVVLTSFFNLMLNLIVVVIFLFAFGVTPTWTWFLFPVDLALLIVVTVAVSLIVSSLYPRYRDISIIWAVFATALFYATPILYPTELVVKHPTLRHIMLFNPLAPIMELARKWLIQPSAPGPVAAAGGYLELLPTIAIFIGLCVFGVWIFNREAPRIAEQL